MGAGHQRCFAPRALQAEASTDHSGARRPVSQHPGGKDAEKRETTPPRATCVGYPARRPAEPSGSLPTVDPLETRRELPDLVERVAIQRPVAHRLRDLRRLVSVPASPAPGLRATLTVQPGVSGGQLEAPPQSPHSTSRGTSTAGTPTLPSVIRGSLRCNPSRSPGCRAAGRRVRRRRQRSQAPRRRPRGGSARPSPRRRLDAVDARPGATVEPSAVSVKTYTSSANISFGYDDNARAPEGDRDRSHRRTGTRRAPEDT